jgi:hypothetical protein
MVAPKSGGAEKFTPGNLTLLAGFLSNPELNRSVPVPCFDLYSRAAGEVPEGDLNDVTCRDPNDRALGAAQWALIHQDPERQTFTSDVDQMEDMNRLIGRRSRAENRT